MTSLPTRPLGNSDIPVPVIGLGANNFGGRLDLDGTRRVVDAAIDAGVTHIDTADVYGRHFAPGSSAAGVGRSEELLGEVLRGRRDKVFLATKFGSDMNDGYDGPRGGREYINRAIDASLGRLQTDVIDLYWYHRPDETTPVEETFAALNDLVSAGKVRATGASNFTPEQLRQATGVSALQNQYSLLHRDPERDGTLQACEELNVAFIPYFPLASGLLTGKYSRNGDRPSGSRLAERDELASDAEWALIEALQAYAEERELTLTQVAIGGLLTQPAVASVIAGATKPEQIASNVAAADWQPTAEDVSALGQILDAHPA